MPIQGSTVCKGCTFWSSLSEYMTKQWIGSYSYRTGYPRVSNFNDLRACFVRSGYAARRSFQGEGASRIADWFLSQGEAAQIAGFVWIPLDISDFTMWHNYGLALWQSHIERILAECVGELAMPIYRRREVTGFAQDDTGVDVALSDGRSLRAEYPVECDSRRSRIRKAAGIAFPGWEPTTSHLIAEVELAEEPELGLRRDIRGIHALSRMGDGGPVRRCGIL
jgi:3-(3-hydroxy-phenyl)propionate hydroxylase